MLLGMPAAPRIPPPGELELLDQIRGRGGSRNFPGLRLGIGDDCALLRLRPREELAVTTDLSIAGRHFRLDWHPPEAVGHRTLARGLSDLAAMGARPLAAFVSLGLPKELAGQRTGRGRLPIASAEQRKSWLTRFYDGLLALAEAEGCPLAGGDLAESPLAVADIVLTGAVERGRALLRSGARPGDLLYVTGALGGAASGHARLGALAAGSAARSRKGPLRIPDRLLPSLAPHLAPQPRVAVGRSLARHRWATAAIDVSDGLSTDLHHICQESGVFAEVDAPALPVAPGATLHQALDGGEDYELLFTARPVLRMPRRIAGVPITCIGRIVRRRAGRPVLVLRDGERAVPLAPRGWQHFV